MKEYRILHDDFDKSFAGPKYTMPAFLLISEVHCPAFQPGAHVIVKGSGTAYGTELDLSCKYGYAMQGNDDVTSCQADQTWSSTGPLCIEIICDIPTHSNQLILSSTNNKLDDVIQFSCYYGFQLEGSTQVQCKTGSVWSSSFPSCNGKLHSIIPIILSA